jgi:hypothetical protein
MKVGRYNQHMTYAVRATRKKQNPYLAISEDGLNQAFGRTKEEAVQNLIKERRMIFFDSKNLPVVGDTITVGPLQATFQLMNETYQGENRPTH